jgi:hypothetical protein
MPKKQVHFSIPSAKPEYKENSQGQLVDSSGQIVNQPVVEEPVVNELSPLHEFFAAGIKAGIQKDLNRKKGSVSESGLFVPHKTKKTKGGQPVLVHVPAVKEEQEEVLIFQPYSSNDTKPESTFLVESFLDSVGSVGHLLAAGTFGAISLGLGLFAVKMVIDANSDTPPPPAPNP